MEWAPFKSLFWYTNGSIKNLTIYFKSGVSLGDRPCYQNMLIYESYDKCQKLTKIQNKVFFNCQADTGFYFKP